MWLYIQHHGYSDWITEKPDQFKTSGVIYLPTFYYRIIIEDIVNRMVSSQFGFCLFANEIYWDKRNPDINDHRHVADLNPDEIDISKAPDIFIPFLSRSGEYQKKVNKKTAEECSFFRMPMRTIKQ